MIAILKCSGLATVQDLGWRLGRSIGLPRSGAMVPPALRLANALVGNEGTDAGLEIALGGVVLEFARAARVALVGAAGDVTLGGDAVPPETTLAVRLGDRLTVGRTVPSRFLYVAVSGGIAIPPLLGSRSTYLPTGLGGWMGRRLLPGDVLPVGPIPQAMPPDGTVAPPDTGPDESPIRILPAPQHHLFDPSAILTLETEAYTVSPASDRMGSRLVGVSIAPRVKASQPSEATCLGAIQVPDAGQPIVILADGPTVGGYPKIGAVAGLDLGRFAEIPLGGTVRFQWITVGEAQRLHYQWTERFERRISSITAGYRPVS